MLAQITNPVLNPDLQGETGAGFITEGISRAVGMFLVIGSVIFFFVMAIGAIQWIVSGGDKAAVESAKSKLSNAIIGLVVLFSLFAIAKLIEWFTGVDVIHIDLGPLQIN